VHVEYEAMPADSKGPGYLSATGQLPVQRPTYVTPLLMSLSPGLGDSAFDLVLGTCRGSHGLLMANAFLTLPAWRLCEQMRWDEVAFRPTVFPSRTAM
jgi:hypothetical protein